MTPRRLRRRVRVALGRVLPAATLITLGIAAWLIVAYVCGRKVWMVQDAQHFMRLALPGIW